MMMRTVRRIGICYGIALALAHCGSGAEESDDAAALRIAPRLHLTRAATISHPQTTIARYELLLARAGETVAYTGAPADARAISLPEVPLGDDYRIEVTGYNAQEEVVFLGMAEQLSIHDAERSIDITLQQVPLFAELRESAVIANTRFAPRVIAAPGNSIELAVAPVSAPDAASAASPDILPDLATNALSLTVPLDRGETAFHPAPLAPGAYRVRVRDRTNGLTAERTITVTDGKLRRAAPLMAFARTVGDRVRASRGGVWAAPVQQSPLAWWQQHLEETE